jgi:hypothetical protein
MTASSVRSAHAPHLMLTLSLHGPPYNGVMYPITSVLEEMPLPK